MGYLKGNNEGPVNCAETVANFYQHSSRIRQVTQYQGYQTFIEETASHLRKIEQNDISVAKAPAVSLDTILLFCICHKTLHKK